jgi:hypothetical protein
MANQLRPPTFNLTINRWRNGVPTTAPPTAVLAGQFRVRGGVGLTRLGQAFPTLARLVCLPKGTTVIGQTGGTNADTLEVPAGTGRYYTVEDHDDVARGFPNEYRLCLLIPTFTWNPTT